MRKQTTKYERKGEKTRKRGNCECIATWGRPSQAS